MMGRTIFTFTEGEDTVIEVTDVGGAEQFSVTGKQLIDLVKAKQQGRVTKQHHCEGCERVYPPVVIREALESMKSKGEEHNNQQVSFASYCPLGLRSAATLLHREALRVVVEADRGNDDGVWEHLIDTVVFAILMAGEVRFK